MELGRDVSREVRFALRFAGWSQRCYDVAILAFVFALCGAASGERVLVWIVFLAFALALAVLGAVLGMFPGRAGL